MKKISDRNLRSYKEQYWYAEYFAEHFLNIKDLTGLQILEVGAAEGGLLRYFYEKGHHCYGIEYSGNRYGNSIQLNADIDICFIKGDITESISFSNSLSGKMDIVVCRDVIEHIHPDKKFKALENMFNLLESGGKLFITFPTKYSPYAGHQQVTQHKLAWIPYIYFLPDNLYGKYLSMLGVPENVVKGLKYIKHSRISISQFERMVSNIGLSILKKELFIVRPCYESRFRLKRIRNPFKHTALRELLTFGGIYLLIK